MGLLPCRRAGGSAGGVFVPWPGTGVCLADARELAMMAFVSESRVSWEEPPVPVRRIGWDGLGG